MVAQDISFIYHSELEGVARERRWYMNGVSWANIVYLFNILTVIGECNQQTVYFFMVGVGLGRVLCVCVWGGGGGGGGGVGGGVRQGAVCVGGGVELGRVLCVGGGGDIGVGLGRVLCVWASIYNTLCMSRGIVGKDGQHT